MHCTSSKYIGPVPEPKKALLYGIPAAEFSKNSIRIKFYKFTLNTVMLDIKSETAAIIYMINLHACAVHALT